VTGGVGVALKGYKAVLEAIDRLHCLQSTPFLLLSPLVQARPGQARPCTVGEAGVLSWIKVHGTYLSSSSGWHGFSRNEVGKPQIVPR